jgi:hypothetical protein
MAIFSYVLALDDLVRVVEWLCLSTWLLVNDTGIFAASCDRSLIDRGEIKTWRPGSQVPVSNHEVSDGPAMIVEVEV